METNCDAACGIGVVLSGKIIQNLIASKTFTLTEWENNPTKCVELLDVPYIWAGNEYEGGTYYYLAVKGTTLIEINENAPSFLEKLNLHGINITMKDLKVIEDSYIF